MSVSVDDREMVTASLSGLPLRFDSSVSTLHAAHTIIIKLNFVCAQICWVRKEQRQVQRSEESPNPSESAALVPRPPSRPKRRNFTDNCALCGRHTNSVECYKTFPHFASPRHHD